MAHMGGEAATGRGDLGDLSGTNLMEGHPIDALGNAANAADSKIERLSRSVFSSKERDGNIDIEGSHSPIDKKIERIQELTNNPDKMLEHLTNATAAIFDHAPQMSAGLQSSIINGIQFLNSKIPRPLVSFPGQEWEPTKSQIAQYNQYHNTIEDPLSVMEHIKQGTLQNSHMEALGAVYPILLQHLQTKLIENATPKALSTLPYAAKIAVSKFIGQPLEESLMPQVVAANQVVYQMASNLAANAPRTRSRKSLGGMAKLDQAKREATETYTDEESGA